MVSDRHEYYNIQEFLIKDLAEKLFFLEEKLSKAFEGKAKEFKESQSWINSMKNKIRSLKLGYSNSDMEKIGLYLKLSEISENQNEYEKATEYLWEAFVIIGNIFRQNNMIFPAKTKGMTFKDYVVGEVG